MCSITLIVSFKARENIYYLGPMIGEAMIKAAEEAWPILERTKDRDFKMIVSDFDIDAVNVEIHAEYQKGKGAYEKGVTFNPTEAEQKHLAQALEEALVLVVKKKDLTYFTWVRGYAKSYFHQH